jgi:hypothetical protein
MSQEFTTGRYCRQCGAQLAGHMKFCPQCGASVPVTAEIGTSPPANTPTTPLPPALAPAESLDRLVVPIQNPTPPPLTPPAQAAAPVMSRYRPKLYAVIALELLAGIAMLFAYRTFIRPQAPHASGKPVASATQPATTAQPPKTQPETPIPPATATTPPAATVAEAPVPSTSAPVPPRQNPATAASATKSSTPSSTPTPIKPPAPPTPTRAETKSSPTDHIRQGQTHFAAGQYAQALAEYRQARRLVPGNADVGYLMGLTLEKMGQPDAALQAYESCTSGPYAGVAQNHVKRLRKKLGK